MTLNQMFQKMVNQFFAWFVIMNKISEFLIASIDEDPPQKNNINLILFSFNK